jgi:hypothetical protein
MPSKEAGARGVQVAVPPLSGHAPHTIEAPGAYRMAPAPHPCVPLSLRLVWVSVQALQPPRAIGPGASRPWPEGARPLLVLSSSPAAAGVLGSVVYLGRHGEGIFAGGFFAAVIATAVAAEGHRGQVRISWEYTPVYCQI